MQNVLSFKLIKNHIIIICFSARQLALSTAWLSKTIKLSCWTGICLLFKQLGKTIPLSYRVCHKSFDVFVRQFNCLTDIPFVCITRSRQDNFELSYRDHSPLCLAVCIYISQDNSSKTIRLSCPLPSSSLPLHTRTSHTLDLCFQVSQTCCVRFQA